MSDLNILGMMMGEKPGYAPDNDVNGQRLMVIMAVSPDDIGRGYGGNLADMAGKANDPDVVASEVGDALSDSLTWLQTNSEDLPDDFTAVIDSTDTTEDSLTVRMSAGPEDELEQLEMTIGTTNA